ncbi:MAG: tetratricopeptide repeat protein [Magnetococcales bacterium]|nr:tetratricopeptide repeat protein [Magnetococcales bacterium]
MTCGATGVVITLEKGRRVVTLLQQGDIFKNQRRYDEAIACYQQAIAAEPQLAEAHFSLGVIYHVIRRLDQAQLCYERAIVCDPTHMGAYNNLGALLDGQQRWDQAADCCLRALHYHPQSAQLYDTLGVIRQRQQRYTDAVNCFRWAIAHDPQLAGAWYNLGQALESQHELDQAIACYQRLLQLQPDHIKARHQMGLLMLRQNRLDEAAEHYRRVVQLRPDYIKSVAHLIHVERELCDWHALETVRQKLVEPVLAWRETKDGSSPPEPMLFLVIPDITEAEQLSIVTTYARYKQSAIQPLPYDFDHRRTDPESRRLRVGYISPDFRNHPVAHQMLGLFRRHDRHRFEIFVYSLGQDDGSYYRRRIEDDVDHFVDLRRCHDRDAAQRIRQDGIDLLIDLNGHTGGARTEILAHRPAPVQMVHFFSTGADHIDYLLTDRFFIPPDRQRYYHEKIIYLPNCLIPTDCEQPIAPTTPERRAHGLPEQGFVFCSFSSHYKIEPHGFGVWMALLQGVPGSVLWLSDGPGRANLQRAAAERGINPDRLIFAPRLPDKADHLARHRWADLFLDTLYYSHSL